MYKGQISIVLNEEVLGKKVRVGVAFNTTQCGMSSITTCTNTYEGVVTAIGTLGEEEFLVFEDGDMINLKYIQTIEIIG